MQSKGYTFVSAPKHVSKKLLKPNKVTLYGSQVKIEEAKFPRGQTTCCFITSLKPFVVNKNIKDQYSLENLPLVPGKRKCCEAAQPCPSHYKTLIFTDSVPKCIRMYQFNSLLRNRKGQILNFPGFSSKQM